MTTPKEGLERADGDAVEQRLIFHGLPAAGADLSYVNDTANKITFVIRDIKCHDDLDPGMDPTKAAIVDIDTPVYLTGASSAKFTISETDPKKLDLQIEMNIRIKRPGSNPEGALFTGDAR